MTDPIEVPSSLSFVPLSKYMEVQQLLQSTEEEDAPDIDKAEALESMGTLEFYNGEYEKACVHLEKSLSFTSVAHRRKPRRLGILHLLLGASRLKTGEIAKSIESFEECFRISKSSSNFDITAMASANQAVALTKLKKFKDAVSVCKQAMEITAKMHSNECFEYLQFAKTLISIYVKTGDFKLAEKVLEETEFPDTDRYLLDAGVQFAAGKIDKARKVLAAYREQPKTIQYTSNVNSYNPSTVPSRLHSRVQSMSKLGDISGSSKNNSSRNLVVNEFDYGDEHKDLMENSLPAFVQEIEYHVQRAMVEYNRALLNKNDFLGTPTIDTLHSHFSLFEYPLRLMEDFIVELRKAKGLAQEDLFDPYNMLPYDDKLHPSFVPFDYYLYPVITWLTMIISDLENKYINQYMYSEGLLLEKGMHVMCEYPPLAEDEELAAIIGNRNKKRRESLREPAVRARYENQELSQAFQKVLTILETCHLVLDTMGDKGPQASGGGGLRGLLSADSEDQLAAPAMRIQKEELIIDYDNIHRSPSNKQMIAKHKLVKQNSNDSLSSEERITENLARIQEYITKNEDIVRGLLKDHYLQGEIANFQSLKVKEEGDPSGHHSSGGNQDITSTNHVLNENPDISITKEIVKNIQILNDLFGSSSNTTASPGKQANDSVTAAPPFSDSLTMLNKSTTTAAGLTLNNNSFASSTVSLSNAAGVVHTGVIVPSKALAKDAIVQETVEILNNHNIQVDRETGKLIYKEQPNASNGGNKKSRGGTGTNNSGKNTARTRKSAGTRSSVGAGTSAKGKGGGTGPNDSNPNSVPNSSRGNPIQALMIANELSSFSPNLYIPMVKDRLSMYSDIIYTMDSFGRDEINAWIVFALTNISGISIGYLGQGITSGEEYFKFLQASDFYTKMPPTSMVDTNTSNTATTQPAGMGTRSSLLQQSMTSTASNQGNTIASVAAKVTSGIDAPMKEKDSMELFYIEIRNRLIEIDTKLSINPLLFYNYNVESSLMANISSSVSLTGNKQGDYHNIAEDFQYLAFRVIILIILVKLTVQCLIKSEINTYLMSLEKLTTTLYKRYNRYTVEVVIYQAIAMKYRLEYEEWLTPVNSFNTVIIPQHPKKKAAAAAAAGGGVIAPKEDDFGGDSPRSLASNGSAGQMAEGKSSAPAASPVSAAAPQFQLPQVSANEYLTYLVMQLLPWAKKYYEVASESHHLFFRRDACRKLANIYISIGRLPITGSNHHAGSVHSSFIATATSNPASSNASQSSLGGASVGVSVTSSVSSAISGVGGGTIDNSVPGSVKELQALDDQTIEDYEAHNPFWVHRFAKLRALHFIHIMKDLGGDPRYLENSDETHETEEKHHKHHGHHRNSKHKKK